MRLAHPALVSLAIFSSACQPAPNALAIPSEEAALRVEGTLAASGPVLAVACAADGRRGLAAAMDGTLSLLQLEPLRELARFDTGSEPLLGTGFLDGASGPFAFSRAAVHLFDDGLQGETRRLSAKGFEIRIAAPTRDGSRFLAVSRAAEMRSWDSASGQELSHRGPLGFTPLALAPLPDGSMLLALADGTARILDASTFAERRRVAIPSSNDAIVAAAAGGSRLLATGGRTPTACVWDLSTGRESHCFGEGAALWSSAAALSADGELALIASPNGNLMLWRSSDRQPAARLGLTGLLTSLAVCPRGNAGQVLLLAGSEEAAILLLRARSSE